MTAQIWRYTWTFYFYFHFHFYCRFLQPNQWKVSYEQMLSFTIIWTPNIAVFEAYQLQSILCRHCVNGICLKYEPKVWTEHGRTVLNRTEQNETEQLVWASCFVFAWLFLFCLVLSSGLVRPTTKFYIMPLSLVVLSYTGSALYCCLT